MKTKIIVTTAALLLLVQSLNAQTADEFVSQGRAFLSQSNLSAANNSFASAVASSPDNPSANVFYAATRLLVLPSQPVASNFLSRIGVPLSGRDIYHWTAELAADTNGLALVPDGVNAKQFTAVLRTNGLPALIGADENLAKVINTNFILNLTSNETRTVSVTLDYGDILMLRAMLHASEYFIYTTYSWNLDAQLAAIRALYTSEELTIERVLMDYPNLLTFATTNDLAAAKIAFQSGTDLYLQASEFIRNRPTNVTRLFNYDAGKATAEQKFRLTIADLTKSLNGAIPLAVDTNYTVFLAEHFNGTHPFRSFLPAFHGKGFVLGTLEDPTFGGLIHGFTEDAAEVLLADHLLPVPTIAPGSSAVGEEFQFSINAAKGRGYVVQVSTNLLDWTDYAAFVSMGGQYGFVDTNAVGFPHRYYRVEDRTGNMPPPSNAIGMALIPAGSFTMGDTLNDGWSGELPTHTAYVSAFYMDKTEVTKALWDSVYTWAVAHGYSFDSVGSGKASNHPVHSVNWYDMVKWCNARSEKEGRVASYYTDAAQTKVYRTGQVSVQNDWVKWNVGYRLPTEAEWEKAARGGASGKRFPWGDIITHSQANYDSYSGYAYDTSPTRGYHPSYDNDPTPYTSPVGSFAPNGYGLYDMAGNVWERCWDWYGSYSSGSQTDPRGPTSGSRRVNRGGCWNDDANNCRVAYHIDGWPGNVRIYIGFRSALPSGPPAD